jgi:tetratricopeptide (TPR) repeat protein
MSRYSAPDNADDFENFCLILLRRHWTCPLLERFAHSGEEQEGVDLLDLSGREPLRAAQCKLRKLADTFTPADLREEVAKVKTFPLPIGEYTLLTSAKKSRDLHLEIVKINQAHRDLKLFTVEVITWEGIERLLDQYPEVAMELAKLPAAFVVRDMNANRQVLDQLVGKIDSVIPAVQGDRFEAELSEARMQLEKHEYQLARVLLQRLRSQQWDHLTPRQRYRLLVNFAASLMGEGRHVEAADFLIEAKSYLPDDGEALGHEALGLELKGRGDEAFARAVDVVARLPTARRAAGVLVRSAPASMLLEEIEAKLPASKDDSEVLVALGYAALNRDKTDRAVELCRRATEVSPKWSPGWLSLGKVLLGREVRKFNRGRSEAGASVSRDELGAAEQSITRAIELANESRATYLLPDCFASRAHVRLLLDADADADKDLAEALRLGNDHPEVLLMHAERLADSGRHAEALVSFRRAAAAKDQRAEFLLPIALSRGTENEEKQEAVRLFRQVAAVAGHPFKDDAIYMAVRGHIGLGEIGEAESFLAGVNSEIPPPLVPALQSDIVTARGAVDQALALGLEASAKLDDATPAPIVRYVGMLLMRLGRYDEAVSVWQRVADSAWLTPDTQALLDCAVRADRHEVVLATCKSLRENGFATTDTVHLEVQILDRYDRGAAVEILRDHLARNPDDKLAILWLSIQGLSLDRPELVCRDRARLPNVNEAAPGTARHVVTVLLETDQPREGVDYAYQYLRRHFNNAVAHRTFILSMMPDASKTPLDLDQPDSVAVGTAVSYSEQGAEQKWVVLEDQALLQDETASSSGLAKLIIGKKAGETVVVSPGVQDRAITIHAVLHKYVYRYNEAMNNWQLRFPEDPFLQAVKFPTDETGKMDFAALFKFAEQRKAHAESITSAYRDNAIPVHFVGHMLNMDTLGAMVSLAEEASIEVKCGGTDPANVDEALAALGGKGDVAIDSTAVATLLMLGCEGVLSKMPSTRLMSFATSAELDAFLERAAPRGMFASIRRVPEGLQGHEFDEATLATLRRDLERRVAAVKAACPVVGCPELAALKPKEREELIQVCGQAGAETVLLASRPGAILWTDDGVVAGAMRHQFGVRRVWTEVVLRHLASTGMISQDEYQKAAAWLVARRYVVTPFGPETVLAAGNLTSWDPSKSPLREIFAEFGREGVDVQRALPVLAKIMVAIVGAIELPMSRAIVLTSLLEHVGSSKQGPSAIKLLRRLVPVAFSLNVIGCHEALTVIDAWLKTRERPLFP